MSRWNEWVLLVCDMEKYKRPALQQEPNVYLEPKLLRCPQCCSGLQLIGPAHEELETPEAVLGQALRLEVILLSKEKAAAPRPKPRGRPRQASREASRQASREVLREASRQVSRQASRQASRRASRHREAGLEACFEQVAQGLWLVRRVHRRSKTISLPGRLELPTLRLTASRSNQPSHGSLCRRPKLVPVLEKRLNNSWLQMVCQTKGQQPT